MQPFKLINHASTSVQLNLTHHHTVFVCNGPTLHSGGPQHRLWWGTCLNMRCNGAVGCSLSTAAYCTCGLCSGYAVKCTTVWWDGRAVTSSRSPKGSQKVTALPCISTPHCSPTSQLLHSDLYETWRMGVGVWEVLETTADAGKQMMRGCFQERAETFSTYQMPESSSPTRAESKSSRSTACWPWSSAVQRHTVQCVHS